MIGCLLFAFLTFSFIFMFFIYSLYDFIMTIIIIMYCVFSVCMVMGYSFSVLTRMAGIRKGIQATAHK